MRTVKISDTTMKQSGRQVDFSLSFKEKIELSKLLDRLGLSVIELTEISNVKIDSLLIKSIASAVNSSILAVPVSLGGDTIDITWQALKDAKHPRLQVYAPVSSVQMEYLFHKKPDAMVSAVADTIRACKAVCADVEFIAGDATRSDESFLYKVLDAAIAAGATTVTVCDDAGALLPDEFSAFVGNLQAGVPVLNNVALGVACDNGLFMADACAVAALKAGAAEVKAATYPVTTASVAHIATVLNAKGSALALSSTVDTTRLHRTAEQVARLCQSSKEKKPAVPSTLDDSAALVLTARDDAATVAKAAQKLGYDLSQEDTLSVYAAFSRIAAKKEKVGALELEAIVAAAAMQVPPTYVLDNYVITAASATSSSAHMKLLEGDKVLEGVSLGDGAIDAAFHALEQITGHHYELDDFQIQAVTEGREAMGQTVVKLRAGDKVYSGRGISTDIVGASIHAYLNALNKIVYEEAEV